MGILPVRCCGRARFADLGKGGTIHKGSTGDCSIAGSARRSHARPGIDPHPRQRLVAQKARAGCADDARRELSGRCRIAAARTPATRAAVGSLPPCGHVGPARFASFATLTSPHESHTQRPNAKLSNSPPPAAISQEAVSVLFVLPPELNLVVARGEGSHVFDVAGREYIDYHLGSGPALLGHAHPAITAAVMAQLPKGTTFYFLNEPEIELAQRLVEAIPCADAVHYVGSGTEATFLRTAHGARTHGPQQDSQVRGRVARHARLRAVGHGADVAFALSALGARFRRRPTANR